jgi:hypothetical protein
LLRFNHLTGLTFLAATIFNIPGYCSAVLVELIQYRLLRVGQRQTKNKIARRLERQQVRNAPIIDSALV